MAFDWKELERNEKQRNDRQARLMGFIWVMLSVVGLVVALATHSGRMVGVVVTWLVIGIILLIATRHRSEKTD